MFDVEGDVVTRLDDSIDGIVDEILRLITRIFGLSIDERDDFGSTLPTIDLHAFRHRLHIG